MKFNFATLLSSALRSCAARLRWVLPTLLCLSFILGQSLPMSAAQNGAVWMEICGEHGPKLVQVEADGSAPASEPDPTCAHCSYCLAQVTGTSGVLPAFETKTPNLALTKSFSPCPQVRVVNEPEHYWSLCRGPPNGNEYYKMISALYVKTVDTSMMPNTRLGAS